MLLGLLLTLSSFDAVAMTPPCSSPMDACFGRSNSGRGQGRSSPRSSATDSQTVRNPTSGASLAVYVYTPSQGSGPYKTLVFVPGAVSSGAEIATDALVQPLLSAGYALVFFDPDGRGQSGGTEDYGGTTQQDGLAAVLSSVAKDSRFDPKHIGVVSLSYGVTMATGALTRHDTVAKFLIDWEGPADRAFSAGCGGNIPQSNRANAIPFGDCDDNSWWRYREADKLIGSLDIPYQRVQYMRDHVQPNAEHAVAMAEAAIEGSVPWVRVNDGAANARVDSVNDIDLLSNSTPLATVLVRYANQLMAM